MELYSDFSIKQVKTSRAINCKASESAGLCQGTGLHGDIVYRHIKNLSNTYDIITSMSVEILSTFDCGHMIYHML